MSNLVRAPDTSKLPDVREIAPIQKVIDSESEADVKRRKKKQLADIGRKQTMFAGIKNALKKRLGGTD